MKITTHLCFQNTKFGESLVRWDRNKHYEEACYRVITERRDEEIEIMSERKACSDTISDLKKQRILSR